MSVLAAILTVLCGLVSLVWVSRHLMIRRENRTSFVLTGNYNGPPPERRPIDMKRDEKCIEIHGDTQVLSVGRFLHPHIPL